MATPVVVVSHPGAPVSDGVSQNALAASTPVTYNNGLYTPWTPTSAAVVTPAVVTATVPTTAAVVSSPQLPSVIVSPSSAATVPSPVTSSLPQPSTVAVATSTAIMTTPTVTFASVVSSSLSPTTVTSEPASTSSAASESDSTTSDTSTSATSSTSSLSAFDADSKGSGKASGTNVAIPAVVSLLVLAMLVIGAWVFAKRRKAKRSWSEARRYDDDEAEKTQYGYNDKGTDTVTGAAAWTTFSNPAPYDDPYNAVAGGSSHYETQYNAHRGGLGWQNGSNDQNGVAPGAPSLPPARDAALNEMMADSRRGYEPYQQPPQRQNSVRNAAVALYSSLSARNKRFGTGGSVASRFDQGAGHWDDQGIWHADKAQIVANHYGTTGFSHAAGSDAPERPLLSCVDETPRKSRNASHRKMPATYAESPTTTSPPRYPSPGVLQSKARSQGASMSSTHDPGLDSPSLYSPSAYGYGVSSPSSTFPDSLQPGRSPGFSSRPASPAVGRNPLASSTASGTTYSLGGVAGLLYGGNTQADVGDAGLTAVPQRKSRKKSAIVKARSPLAQDDDDSPHRAISRVVKASRERSDSTSDRNSRASDWSDRVRYLRPSNSQESINNLLSDVLGTARHS
ncbi:hypothetical protein EMMF5_001038 [Cystobasidiomycetes sp. EMM_F5]